MKIAFSVHFVRFKRVYDADRRVIVKKKCIILTKNLRMLKKSCIFAQNYA